MQAEPLEQALPLPSKMNTLQNKNNHKTKGHYHNSARHLLRETLHLQLILCPQLNINKNIYLLHIDFYLRAKTAKCNLIAGLRQPQTCSTVALYLPSLPSSHTDTPVHTAVSCTCLPTLLLLKKTLCICFYYRQKKYCKRCRTAFLMLGFFLLVFCLFLFFF